MMQMKRFGLSMLVLTVMLWSGASANTILFTNDATTPLGTVGSLTVTSVAPGQTVTVTFNNIPSATSAGQFNIMSSISNITEVFCVDLENFISLNQPYNNKYQIYAANGRVGALLLLKNSFFSAAINLADLNNRAAAFQIALWEIAYDHAASNPDDLDDGIFKYNGNTTIVTYANSLLSTTVGQTASYFYLRGAYGSDPSQDLVSLVPEPTSLLALTVGVVGLFHRRRLR